MCVRAGCRLYSALYAGGSLAAAQALVGGDDIAINLMGGQTHARRDCASGFSYVNDVVLAILHLLRAPPGSLEDPSSGGAERRVMFVNLDGWHCSGVEEAFYTTDRVLCLSLHRYAEGVYPGSGGRNDSGMDAGKHHNINLPVSDGLDDAGLELLLMPVLRAAAERYCPHCIVCCAGAGVISGDRLGCLNVSIAAHASVMKALAELGVPLLVLGGGGYTVSSVARCWTYETACLLEADISLGKIPDNDYSEYFGPDNSLFVPATGGMLNENSHRDVEKIKNRIFEHLRMVQGAPSVQMKHMPPEMVLEEDDDGGLKPDGKEAEREPGAGGGPARHRNEF